MKFKTDENMPIEAADDLRQAGHDALTAVGQQLAGQPDARVAEVCRMESRALVTLDLDFSDIRVYPPSDFAGIVVLRPSLQSIKNIQRRRRVREVLTAYVNDAGKVLAQRPSAP